MTTKKAESEDNPTTPITGEGPGGDAQDNLDRESSAERPARLDKSYVERSYKDAMTKEQRETLKEEGLL